MRGIFGSTETPSIEPEVRRARLEAARRNQFWSEVNEAALSPRERWLVHRDSDEYFAVFRAPVFETGSANIAFNDRVPLAARVLRAGIGERPVNVTKVPSLGREDGLAATRALHQLAGSDPSCPLGPQLTMPWPVLAVMHRVDRPPFAMPARDFVASG